MTLVDTSSRSIIPGNEAGRMMAVRRYDILDTPPDGAFDHRDGARWLTEQIAQRATIASDALRFHENI